MFSRGVAQLNTIRANYETFWPILSERYNQRFAQQYGMLMGSSLALEQDKPVTTSQAIGEVDMLDLSDNKESVYETDETSCLDFLLDTVINLDSASGRIQRKIIECLQERKKNIANYNDSLIRLGIVPEGDFMYVACKDPQLQKIFKDTKWLSGWSKSLARIDGAEKNVQKKVLGKNARYVKIPISFIDATE